MKILIPDNASADKQMELAKLVGDNPKLSKLVEKALAAGYVPLIYFVDPEPETIESKITPP